MLIIEDEPLISGIVKVMDSSLKRQEKVIYNILDLSRLEAGGRKYKLKKVALKKVVEEAVEDYQTILILHGIEVLPALANVSIKTDRDMFYHVISNLVNNAIKYRTQTAKPVIDISLKKKGKRSLATRL